MHEDITGVILAGGQSRRLGVNKALLKIGDQTVIEIAVRLMRSVFSKNLLCVNDLPAFAFLQLPMVQDLYRQGGPLAGLHAALHQITTSKAFLIPCDMPLLNKELIEFLLDSNSDKPIWIARAAGRLQPLPGCYDKRLLPTIETLLHSAKRSGEYHFGSFHRLLDLVDAEIMDPTELDFYREELFFNINNKEDYEKLHTES